MENLMKRSRTLTTSFALLMISLSGLAAAGPDHKEKSKDKDLLRGPKVVDTNTTTQRHRKEMMQDQPDRQNAQRDANAKRDHALGFRDYILALRQLQNPNAQNVLNLTDAQRDQIKMIMQEQRTAMEAFKEEHQEQFKKMREQGRSTTDQKQPRGDRPAIESDDQSKQGKRGNRNQKQLRENPNAQQRRPQGDRSMQARDKLRQFIENAPPNTNALAKIRQVLTQDQKDIIKAHIRKNRAERAQNGQRPNQAQRQRRANDNANPNTDHPTARRRMNNERVNNEGKRDAQRGKRTKGDKPPSDDD
jgi:Spy/CpxP family protein refolding chaperone